MKRVTSHQRGFLYQRWKVLCSCNPHKDDTTRYETIHRDLVKSCFSVFVNSWRVDWEIGIMGLQSELNDVSSGSIPLLVLAQIAMCVNYLRSMLLAVLQSLGLARFHTHQIVDDRFLAAVGSGLAGLIMLSDQLKLNNQFFCYEGPAHDHRCVVCQAAFQDGDQLRMLPCRHVFHRRCFDGWLHHYKFNCPLCRSPLLSDERVALTERRLGQQLVSWFSLHWCGAVSVFQSPTFAPLSRSLFYRPGRRFFTLFRFLLSLLFFLILAFLGFLGFYYYYY